MDWQQHIERVPGVMLGKPVFRGTRITVEFVLERLAQGAKPEELVRSHPPLTLEQVRAIEEGREVPATGPRSQREVTNYFAGLRFVEKNAQRSAVTHAEVLKLHRIMAGAVMDQGTAGRYRTIRVRVGSHVAPPPEKVHPFAVHHRR